MKSGALGNTGKTPLVGKPAQRLLRVLIVEDDLADAELCQWELKRGGIDFSADVARTCEEFLELVRLKEYDIVLSDYNLRTWNALDAIQTLHKEGKDIPVVLVTGSLGDEAAVDCVKKGISDYVLKDRMARLPVAINRALQEKLKESRDATSKSSCSSRRKWRPLGGLLAGRSRFNNLLTIINGYSQLILDRLEPDDPLGSHICQIKDAGERAANLTRQLLAFSRRQVLAPQILDLNQVISGIGKMLPRLIGEDIDLVIWAIPALAGKSRSRTDRTGGHEPWLSMRETLCRKAAD